MTVLETVLGCTTALSTGGVGFLTYLGTRGQSKVSAQAQLIGDLQEETRSAKADAKAARDDADAVRSREAKRDAEWGAALAAVYDQLAGIQREMSDLQHGVWTLIGQLRREGFTPEWEPRTPAAIVPSNAHPPFGDVEHKG